MIGGLRFFSMDSDISSGDSTGGISSLSDFAIFYRIGRQSGIIEKALNDHSIPFQTIGEEPYFMKKELQPLRYLMLSQIQPGNEYLRKKIRDHNLESYLIKSFESGFPDKEPIDSRIIEICRTYLSDHDQLSEQYGDTFLRSLEQIGDTSGLYELLTLGHSVDAYEPGLERVSILTLHASKGLEFPCVFITGCEEGLIPYNMFSSQKSDPDEEQRLLYVGMTRAKTFLFLSHARHRNLFGKHLTQSRSRFLDYIENELIDSRIESRKRAKRKDDGQTSLF
jgi:superfamily I DNA/RNA helicase